MGQMNGFGTTWTLKKYKRWTNDKSNSRPSAFLKSLPRAFGTFGCRANPSHNQSSQKSQIFLPAQLIPKIQLTFQNERC